MRLSARAVPRVEVGVLVLGVLLRLYLAVVNREANDDHLSVIRIIALQHHLPRVREAWEGFQPKLYHVSVAMLWNLSPWQSSTARIQIAQLVACVAGIATLFIVRNALISRGISPPIRLLAFALVALNPALIGLNAQATNRPARHSVPHRSPSDSPVQPVPYCTVHWRRLSGRSIDVHRQPRTGDCSHPLMV